MKKALFISIFMISITGCDDTQSRKCVDEYTVKEIVALNYRDADIKLNDDTIMTVNQATLKPGDKICKKWE